MDKELGDKLTIACQAVEHRLDTIWASIDAVDTKTNIILGFASVVLVIPAGFVSVEPSKWQSPSVVLFWLALCSYVILVVLSMFSYRTRQWSYRPDPATLIEHCQDNNYSADDVRAWVAREGASSCCANVALLQKKSKLANLVLYLFAAETVLLGLGLAYTLIIHSIP